MYVYVYLHRPAPYEPIPVEGQETQEKPKFLDLEGTGMLLNTLAKAICELL